MRPTRLEIARSNALLRMSGCAEPNCSACRHNQEALDELVRAASAPTTAGLDVEVERVRDKLCDVLPLLGKKGAAGQARKEIEPLLLQLRKIANALYIPARKDSR